MLESAFSETPISVSACDLHFLRALSHFRHVTFTFWDPYHTFGMLCDSESCSETLNQFSDTPIAKNQKVIILSRQNARIQIWSSESIFWYPYHTFGMWIWFSEIPITLAACFESLNQFSETPITLSACDLDFLRPLLHFRSVLRLWINFLRPLSHFRPVTFNFWDPYHTNGLFWDSDYGNFKVWTPH